MLKNCIDRVKSLRFASIGIVATFLSIISMLLIGSSTAFASTRLASHNNNDSAATANAPVQITQSLLGVATSNNGTAGLTIYINKGSRQVTGLSTTLNSEACNSVDVTGTDLLKPQSFADNNNGLVSSTIDKNSAVIGTQNNVIQLKKVSLRIYYTSPTNSQRTAIACVDIPSSFFQNEVAIPIYEVVSTSTTQTDISQPSTSQQGTTIPGTTQNVQNTFQCSTVTQQDANMGSVTWRTDLNTTTLDCPTANLTMTQNMPVGMDTTRSLITLSCSTISPITSASTTTTLQCASPHTIPIGLITCSKTNQTGAISSVTLSCYGAKKLKW
jgi:hypothetical protein